MPPLLCIQNTKQMRMHTNPPGVHIKNTAKNHMHTPAKTAECIRKTNKNLICTPPELTTLKCIQNTKQNCMHRAFQATRTRPEAWSWKGWPGLAWLGLAWPGMAWPGLAWSGLAWPGLVWPGLA